VTIFLWDASHYDGKLNTTILAKAHGQGIVGFTHKLGEGVGNPDPTAATALAAARDVGIPVIGGYWFNHGTNRPGDEVAAFIAEANRHEPWWKEFPGWFWQADLERSPTGLPSPAWAKEFCDRLRDQTGKTVIAYASHGMYGDTLTGLGHPLWNANYPSSRQAPFRDLYPGDSYSGWTAYSGQTPTLCQYTSSAAIAGLTTCDANAFRGSIDELLTLIGADMALTDADAGVIAGHKTPDGESWIGASQDARTYARAARDQALANAATLAGIVKTEAAIQAALAAIAMAGTSVDTAALAAQIKAVGDQESSTVVELGQRIAELEARIAAAATAGAAALSGGAS
jgi:GH25 family lysozyme M1 (1,4-beta-N-acetylmuramidase)